jgi:16S rRNA processing protein RimM
LESLQELPEGEYYWYQLVGCRVVDMDGREIGIVRSLWDAGGHDLLVVESSESAAEGIAERAGKKRSKEVLIPTTREVLREIDLDGKLLRINAIPGLIESEPTGEQEEKRSPRDGGDGGR